jgi:acetyl-CoA decarbonylase/synthase complex subunit gamma
MSDDNTALRKALELLKDKQPLLYRAQEKNLLEISQLAKSYNASVVVSAPDIDSLSRIALELNKLGVTDLILEPTANNISRKIWQLTQIRRQALKKSNRSVGYPTLAVIENGDIWDEALEAATYIDKYAGIILLKQSESWQVLPLLTLRQNIYTDPQKPLQIEPKFYAIGAVNDKSPVLVTTNFSLTYYTVLGEVEASKIPSYILSVNTEGMSVLTAWAAEKFTVEKINLALTNSGSKDLVSHRRLIIPGYVAVMSGELEDVSGWQVLVGPKEAAGIPSFLKNL